MSQTTVWARTPEIYKLSPRSIDMLEDTSTCLMEAYVYTYTYVYIYIHIWMVVCLVKLPCSYVSVYLHNKGCGPRASLIQLPCRAQRRASYTSVQSHMYVRVFHLLASGLRIEVG